MATSIRIDNLDQTIVEIRALAPAIQRETILELSQIAYDGMQEGARSHTRPPREGQRPPGSLFASIYNRALGPAVRQVGHDEARAPYAAFVLHGTRPHDIYPKDKKALRWVLGNRFIFAKYVRHPGNRADNYLDRAADEAVRNLPAIVDRAMKGL